MVVFTCNHCGDSLQKPKVEKHYQTVCRRVKSLTCVDCFKDFHGEDFAVHIKCITEEERYAAKGSIQGGIVKKGEAKQESWVDMVRSIITKETNLSPKVKNLLETIANYNNTPRKKAKFMNFIKSSSGGRVDMRAVEDVWNLIEKYKGETVKPNPETVKDTKDAENNGKRKLDDGESEATENKKVKTEENGVEKKKSKKRKSDDAEKMDSEENATAGEQNGVEKSVEVPEETTGKKKKKKGKKDKNGISNGESNSQNGVEASEVLANNDETVTKKKNKKSNDKENVADDAETENKLNGDENGEKVAFSYEEAIMNILNKKKNISLKKLQKKVLNSFTKHHGLTETTEKHSKKFMKKLNKMESVKVDSDNVTLVE